ncbi:Phosphate metabolism transcription protein [Ascosphaera acerosa]|nr:Phosphate metabolism transcription protein [Ascosphaera acerosa]
MRFATTLQRAIYPPWKDHYIDYRKLKALLREDHAHAHDDDDDEDDYEDGGATRPNHAHNPAHAASAAAAAAAAAAAWTETDEENFVQELVNVQLDKVNDFQVQTYARLRQRTAAVEAKLEPLKDAAATSSTGDDGGDADGSSSTARARARARRHKTAEDALVELDAISSEVTLLEKYCRINFTGFLKAAKKHDRRRGT